MHHFFPTPIGKAKGHWYTGLMQSVGLILFAIIILISSIIFWPVAFAFVAMVIIGVLTDIRADTKQMREHLLAQTNKEQV